MTPGPANTGAAVRPLTQIQEDDELFRASVRRFARERVAPMAREMDERAYFDKTLLAELFELGLMGIEIPEEYGGAGGTLFQAVLAIEELSRVDPAAALIADVHNTLVNNAILRWATGAQKQRWLPRLAGDTVGAYALSEAQAGSDAFALTTRAVADGAEWVLNGRKQWTSNAVEAGLFLVFANAKPEAGYKGITCFVVERAAAGFAVGRKEDKLGMRASSTCELSLDGVRVGADGMLGAVGQGYQIAMASLNEGRIGIGAQMTGLAAGALELALSYAKRRKQFGKPIAEFQGVQFALAQMATDVEAARLLVYNAARLREAGAPFQKEAAMAKLRASEVAESVASRAVELLGGYGYTREAGVEKLYRDAKAGSIYEGTSHMQMLTIAKRMLA
jgi:alkylation response protein AidB-like acyl-CoA dehydrogenase